MNYNRHVIIKIAAIFITTIFLIKAIAEQNVLEEASPDIP